MNKLTLNKMGLRLEFDSYFDKDKKDIFTALLDDKIIILTYTYTYYNIKGEACQVIQINKFSANFIDFCHILISNLNLIKPIELVINNFIHIDNSAQSKIYQKIVNLDIYDSIIIKQKRSLQTIAHLKNFKYFSWLYSTQYELLKTLPSNIEILQIKSYTHKDSLYSANTFIELPNNLQKIKLYDSRFDFFDTIPNLSKIKYIYFICDDYKEPDLDLLFKSNCVIYGCRDLQNNDFSYLSSSVKILYFIGEYTILEKLNNLSDNVEELNIACSYHKDTFIDLPSSIKTTRFYYIDKITILPLLPDSVECIDIVKSYSISDHQIIYGSNVIFSNIPKKLKKINYYLKKIYTKVNKYIRRKKINPILVRNEEEIVKNKIKQKLRSYITNYDVEICVYVSVFDENMFQVF